MNRNGNDKLYAVRTNRFVWHVTDKGNRESIGKNGLIPQKSETGRVYANNQEFDLMLFWPCPIDCFDADFRLYNYDFWQIDTERAGVDWFIDPNLELDYKAYNCLSKYHYLCTPLSIPKEALKLFFYHEYNLIDYLWYFDGKLTIQENNCVRPLSLCEDLDFNLGML